MLRTPIRTIADLRRAVVIRGRPSTGTVTCRTIFHSRAHASTGSRDSVITVVLRSLLAASLIGLLPAPSPAQAARVAERAGIIASLRHARELYFRDTVSLFDGCSVAEAVG